jgi:hypothetical protein
MRGHQMDSQDDPADATDAQLVRLARCPLCRHVAPDHAWTCARFVEPAGRSTGFRVSPRARRSPPRTPREGVERNLGVRVSDVAWSDFASEFASEIQDVEAEWSTLPALVRAARGYGLGLGQQAKGSSRLAPSRMPLEILQPDERNRSLAESEFLAVVARADSRLQPLRTRLGIGDSDPAAARQCFQNPALGSGFDRPVKRGEQAVTVPHMLPSGAVDQVPVRPGSVLDEVRVLGEELTRQFPWTLPEAVWFVVSDDVPYVDPVRVTVTPGTTSVCRSATIVVAAAPWVSAHTIARAYRSAQQDALGPPRRRRPPDGITLALAPFVEERRQQRPPMTFPAILEEWNSTHPGAPLGDHRYLRRAYRRALAAVFPPARHLEEIDTLSTRAR